MTKTFALALTSLALSGCGPAANPNDAGSDAFVASAVDASVGTDAASATVDAGNDTGPAATACADSAFIDLTGGSANDRMVMVPRGTLTFDNPCITIRAGQAVMFMWDFGAHPLAPGVPGAHHVDPSPIVAQSTGSLYEPTFPTAGDYPYYCTRHTGPMRGVVRVVP